MPQSLILLFWIFLAVLQVCELSANAQYEGAIEQNIQVLPMQTVPQYQPPSQQQYQQPAASSQSYSVLQRGPSVRVPWYLRAKQKAEDNKVRKRVGQLEYYKQTHGGMPPTFLPENAPTGPPIINGVTNGGQDSQVLSWDAWYRLISAVDEPLVEQALASHGYPTGNAHLWVTVTPSHHLSAELQNSTNTVFGQAALKGVRALDGSPALEFPKGSKRGTFSFQWSSNYQGVLGRPPDIVNRTSIVGDYERQYHQW